MLRDAADELLDSFDESERVWIRFRRGVASVELLALPGRTQHDVATSDGGSRTVMTHDWIVRTENLVLAGTAIRPQRGTDQVELLDGHDGTVVDRYLVTHPQGREPYRWCDQWQRNLRIHTTLKD